MVYIRVTPATAMPTVRQLAGDLSKSVKEAGPLPFAATLQSALQRVESDAAARLIEIDVAFTCRRPEANIDLLREILSPHAIGSEAMQVAIEKGEVIECTTGGRSRWRIHVRPFLEPATRRAGECVPGVLLLLVMPPDGEVDPQALEAAVDDRPVVFLVSDSPLSVAAEVRRAASPFERLDVLAMRQKPLLERLVAAPYDSKLDLLCAYGLSSAVDSLSAGFQLALEQEMRGLKAKKSLVQQRAVKAQQKTAPAAEKMLSEFRSRLQRQVNEIERGIEQRFRRASGAAEPGSILAQLETAIQGLQELAFKARARTVIATVPEAIEHSYVAKVTELLLEHGHADLRAIRDFFCLLAADLESSLRAIGAPPVALTVQHMTDERWRRYVESEVVLERRYSAELPKPGFFEYTMIARRYQSVFFMLLSAFGLSFLRQYRLFMIPTSLALLTLGGVSVVRSVRRERRETREKELEKAREMLRLETKRLLIDAHRTWMTMVREHLSEQIAAALAQLDYILRDLQTRRSSETAEETQRLQRQMQGFEGSEKRLLPAIKGRETVSTAIAQVRGELRQMLSAPPASTRPSALGGPAAT